MSRYRDLNRQNRRALAAGIGLSVAFHAAVLVWGGIGIPGRDAQPRATISFEAYRPAETRPEAIQRVVTLEVAVPQAAPASVALFEAAPASASGGAPAAPAAPASAAAATAVAGAGAPNLPAVAAVEEVTFDRISIVDPLSSARVEPIAFTELPEAGTGTPETAVAANIPVYEPGAVGAAKRKWAGGGSGEGAGTTGAGFTIGVGTGRGGHCPMPGRGRGPVAGPYWLAAD